MTQRLEQDSKSLLSTGESARLAGVSLRTLYRYEADGRIRSVRTPGGHRRFRRSDVEALLTRGQAAGNSDQHSVSSAPTPRGEAESRERLDGIAASTAGAA